MRDQTAIAEPCLGSQPAASRKRRSSPASEVARRLGQRIRERRGELRLTQGELGKLAGSDDASICNYEKAVRYPSAATLSALAAALDVPVSWFFAEDATPIRLRAPDADEIAAVAIAIDPDAYRALPVNATPDQFAAQRRWRIVAEHNALQAIKALDEHRAAHSRPPSP